MTNALFSAEELDTLDNSNATYRVMARKYRPSNFAELIGQDSLVQTFQNAVDAKKIPHAFLLIGIRGVGKTTTARIIAKALNCLQSPNDVAKEPCGKCENCIAIAKGSSQDVIEIDAASHTSVNDIREIIDNCRYAPVEGRYKVYIIDEVHMLSNSAFNALLKTLEEPYPHVKFIFATTEAKKIPLTIISRCIRFNLRRLNVPELVMHFEEILKKEGVKEYEVSALHLIATAADGSVRDGLSILEQALAKSDFKLTSSSVQEILGIADGAYIRELCLACLQGNDSKIFEICATLYSQAQDPLNILYELASLIHAITKAKIDPSFLESLFEKEREFVSNILKTTEVSKVLRGWKLLVDGTEEIKNFQRPFEALEMLLIRISHLSNILSPEELMKRFQGGSKPAESIPVAVSSAGSTISSPQSLLQYLYDADEILLFHRLRTEAEVKKVEGNSIELGLVANTGKGLASELRASLELRTGTKWRVIATEDAEVTPILKKEKEHDAAVINKLKDDSDVQDILSTFQDLEIADIKLARKVN